MRDETTCEGNAATHYEGCACHENRRDAEIARLKDLLRWRKWPEEKPEDLSKSILAICQHSAAPEPGEGGRLCTYLAHAEGMSHAVDGFHVLEWGGEYSESDWESGYSFTIPDWWFVAGTDMEVVAYPTHWRPIVGPEEEHELGRTHLQMVIPR